MVALPTELLLELSITFLLLIASTLQFFFSTLGSSVFGDGDVVTPLVGGALPGGEDLLDGTAFLADVGEVGGETLLPCDKELRPLETAESLSESSDLLTRRTADEQGGTFCDARDGFEGLRSKEVWLPLLDGGFTFPVLYTVNGFLLNAGENFAGSFFHGGVVNEILPESRLIWVASDKSLSFSDDVKELLFS